MPPTIKLAGKEKKRLIQDTEISNMDDLLPDNQIQ